MEWRPRIPEKFIQLVREHDGVKRTVYTSVITDVVEEGNQLRFTASAAPECLLADRPLPWSPPCLGRASDIEGFRHWWRELTYVFELPDPVLFPPLPTALLGNDAAKALRFVAVTENLAASATVSAPGGMTVIPGHDSGDEVIQADFPPVDAQAGFAALLRQCHNKNEAASYDSVRNILWMASEGSDDDQVMERLKAIGAWHQAVKGLRRNSLDQLLRDKLVREEGCGLFAWQEEQSPEQLLRAFNYGDLIHWGNGRNQLVTADDEYLVEHQRYAFLTAALGLAHIYVGFGQLVRAATTPRGRLLVP